jgi:hypothetical protein
VNANELSDVLETSSSIQANGGIGRGQYGKHGLPPK